MNTLLLLTLACRNSELKPTDDTGALGAETGQLEDDTAAPTDDTDPPVDDTDDAPDDSGDDTAVDTAPPDPVDEDQDGFDVDSDCDDSNSEIHPDATEICDGVDNDCDALVDDQDDEVEGQDTWHADLDGDGYGDADASVDACAVPSSYVDDATDCDDGDAAVYPAATEVCNDVDDDCDGLVDDDDSDLADPSTWYLDSDGDGVGGSSYSAEACDAPSGFADVDGDCDDSDASVFPGANEACDGVDNDCNGTVDEAGASGEATWYLDADGDGYGDSGTSSTSCDGATGYVADATDCDDADADVNPAATETCNDQDDDCDGLIDDDDTEVEGQSTVYADDDGDAYGDAADSVTACNTPSGHVSDDTDCDDADASAYPGADETCDDVDNDCDALVDDDDPDLSDASTWYLDYDGDGYGSADFDTEACEAPASYVDNAEDCDDTDASLTPDTVWYSDSDGDGYGDPASSTTACEGGSGLVDNAEDCDDSDADLTPDTVWYADDDGDGYGDASSTTTSCAGGSGLVDDATDCDDADADVNPGADEVCDDADNDCDGLVDDDDDDVSGGSTFYADDDGDGYGDASSTSEACDTPDDHVADATDCDDGDGDVNPGADEVCDDLDNDCDGLVDDDDAVVGADATYYADADGDGYGDAGDSTTACDAPSGYVEDDSDCDDGDASVSPDTVWYIDHDGDGYGTSDYTTTSCEQPTGYVDDTSDCDDLDASLNPETLWYADGDGDGFGDLEDTTASCEVPSGHVADDEDCDDSDGAVNPDADELCNGIDDDCDGNTDDEAALDPGTWYEDADGDGYGDALVSTDACDAPSDYVADATDCDDTDYDVNPGAEEVCDGVDSNCDGVLMAGGDDPDGDGIHSCEDDEPYAMDFDTGWGDWTTVDLGGSNVPNWNWSSGMIYEASNAADSIALSPDLGELETYTITVDVWNSTSANNEAGIVFDYDGSSFWMASWSDPTGYYGTSGEVALYQCTGSACSSVISDTSMDYTNGGASAWTELAVSVDGDDIAVWWGGSEILTYTESGASPIGLDQIGLYTWDNDGGVYYDNVVVTNP